LAGQFAEGIFVGNGVGENRNFDMFCHEIWECLVGLPCSFAHWLLRSSNKKHGKD
jgi:hypothetical protein